jgi:periplasmic divalent cation tolerance protein
MPTEYIIVLITVGSSEEAKILSTGLVKEKLAYCVNQIPGVKSTYFWEGEICVDEEIQLLAKTLAHKFSALETWIKANHSYDTPEVIALPIIKGSKEYLKCVDEWCV